MQFSHIFKLKNCILNEDFDNNTIGDSISVYLQLKEVQIYILQNYNSLAEL